MTDPSHASRLRVFIEAGLVSKIPSRFQLGQGQLEMTPYVLSADATAEEGYVGAPFGHPLMRQPLIISQVGIDHFRTGCGLGAQLSSLCSHLQLTYHQGMPVFDLQLVQTHRDGLGVLRRSLEELLAPTTASVRRRRRLAGLIIPDTDSYYRRFLAPGGWIDRATALDYPEPDEESAAFPPEFYSLVGFLNHCASAFPAQPRDLPLRSYPSHFASLATRRFRERHWVGRLLRSRSA